MSWLWDFAKTAGESITAPKKALKRLNRLLNTQAARALLPGEKEMLDVLNNQLGIETPGKTKKKAEAAAELAAMRAIGPTPTGRGDLALETLSGETPEQRRKRLRRLALVLNQGGDPYGELTLGARGLLAR